MVFRKFLGEAVEHVLLRSKVLADTAKEAASRPHNLRERIRVIAARGATPGAVLRPVRRPGRKARRLRISGNIRWRSNAASGDAPPVECRRELHHGLLGGRQAVGAASVGAAGKPRSQSLAFSLSVKPLTARRRCSTTAGSSEAWRASHASARTVWLVCRLRR